MVAVGDLCSLAPGPVARVALGEPPPSKLLCSPALRAVARRLRASPAQDSYLVDSASSHMLVSKIKPCMSKYKQSIP